MAALGPAMLGHLAQRAPLPAPMPVPSKMSDLFLPPPAPPPQDLPPPDNHPPAAAGGDFSIQTIGIDKPGGQPSAPTQTNDYVEITMTPSTAAIPTATPQSVSQGSKGEEGEGDEKGPGHKKPQPSGECRLMGPFAIFVQLGLGGLALMSLVFKRWRERPQRPVKIWFFDVSKQVFGSVLVHVANVFMSLLTSGRFSIKIEPGVVSRATVTAASMILRRDADSEEPPYMPNPCSFYLLNLGIDTTLGIPILIFLLHITTALVSYTPLGQPAESIQSGNYGRPPNAWWWLKQSVIYFCGLFGMKICVLIIFLTMPWISHVGDWALGWTDGNEQLQIIFVMMLFPLIMNALQYYIIDSFIKDQTSASSSTSGVSDSRVSRYDQLTDSADDEDSDLDGGESEDDVYTGGDSLDNRTSYGGENGRQRRAEEVTARKRADSNSVKAMPKTASKTTGKAGKRAPVTTTVTSADPEYDPEVDGDSPTIIGSSSSQRSRHGGRPSAVVPKELYPAE